MSELLPRSVDTEPLARARDAGNDGAEAKNLPSFATVRALYAENRFFDAWTLTQDVWARRELLDGLDPESIIFAGRLAGRLGSDKIRRALFRYAAKREPHNPYVRYYCNFIHQRG